LYRNLNLDHKRIMRYHYKNGIYHINHVNSLHSQFLVKSISYTLNLYNQTNIGPLFVKSVTYTSFLYKPKGF